MNRSRARYEAAPARPRLSLPEGARMAVHVIVNVEEWRIDGKLPRQLLTAPAGAEPLPDVANYAWYEYGMRVGIWRMMDVLRARKTPVTMSLNASVCLSYPAIVEAAVRDGWELMGHGYFQRPMSMVPSTRQSFVYSVWRPARLRSTSRRVIISSGV